MRLVINGRFYAAPVTGVQRFAVEVARRLLSGDDATLFLPAGVEPPPGLPAGARIDRGRLRNGHLWEQLELPGRAARAGCDVVLHLAGTAPLGAAAGDVVVIHDVLPLTDPAWFGRRFRGWRRAVLRRSAPRAGRIVTVSDWARDEIVRTLGVARARIAVVAQGLEPFDRPASPEAVRRLRATRGLDGPFLLAVGAGDPRKNLPFLGEVMERRRRRGEPPAPLVAVGAARPSLFRDTGWTPGPDVRLLGRVDDDELHALYTAAAALLFPSRAEGFGRPPLEALACGTPALVADYAAAAGVLGDAATILPLDPDAWADAIAALLSDPAARVRAAADGQRLAARWRWDEAAEAVLDACRAANAEKGHGGR